MNDTILVAVITGLCTAIPSIISSYRNSSKNNALIAYKIDELAKHVEKHNGVIERTYQLENEVDLMKEKIKVANHRIDDLEKK